MFNQEIINLELSRFGDNFDIWIELKQENTTFQVTKYCMLRSSNWYTSKLKKE